MYNNCRHRSDALSRERDLTIPDSVRFDLRELDGEVLSVA
jgi:hypothetical protein